MKLRTALTLKVRIALTFASTIGMIVIIGLFYEKVQRPAFRDAFNSDLPSVSHPLWLVPLVIALIVSFGAVAFSIKEERKKADE